MNDENLIPFSKRTPRERRELSLKGQKRSTEVKRARKTMRELMNVLLDMKMVNEENKNLADKIGLDESDQTNKMSVAVGLLRRAESGDPRAVKVLCGIAGDIFTIPSDQQEQESAKETLETLKDFEIQFVDASTKGGDNEND